MPRWQRIYLAACGGVIGYVMAYVICDFAALPRVTYYAREHTWRFAERVTEPVPMVYYGMLLWGLCGGVVGAALVLIATRFARGGLERRWLQLAGAWAITAVVFAGAYFTWNLWPF